MRRLQRQWRRLPWWTRCTIGEAVLVVVAALAAIFLIIHFVVPVVG